MPTYHAQETGATNASRGRWLRALEGVKPTPPEFREIELDRAGALALLRCDGAVLDLLVSHGLENGGSDEAERFDYHELANIALYSGSGRSVPETAQRFLLRFAEARPSEWTVGKRWQVTWSLRCDKPRCTDGRWLVSLPSHRTAGDAGHVTRAEAETGIPSQVTRYGPAAQLSFTAELAGTRGVLVAPALRDLFAELVQELGSGTLRYQWMPAAMRTDLDAALANGTLDCAAASLLLVARCLRAGHAARSRVGVMLGVVGVEHVVAEVLDADGVWKTLDPVFAHLAARSQRVSPEFVSFCAGSAGNRMLRWALPATESLAGHTCAHGSRSYASDFTASAGVRAA